MLHVTHSYSIITGNFVENVMSSVTKRVQKHRNNLRKNGLRPVQIWVPDTRRTDFARECARQSSLVRHDPHEKEMLELLEQAASTDGWMP